MKCPKCRFDNEAGSRFCAGCGGALQAPRPSTTSQRAAGRQVHCTACGTENPPGSRFCENCGGRLEQAATAARPAPSSAPPAEPAAGKPSGAWWLLPFFLAWVGGIIAWAVVRETDKRRARNLLLFGIGMTVFWIVISALASILPYFLSF